MESDAKPLNPSVPVLLVILGLLLRASFLLYPQSALDSDNALYGLMAKHITEGDFPLFTYGQSYMGALESYVAAFFFIFFGISTYALKLSPFLFSGLFLGAVYFLGKELYGRSAALWALAFAAAAPPTLLVWSAAPRGGYSETLFFGTVLLWMAVRVMRLDGGGLREWAAMGLAAGLGFWTHLLIVYYVIPVAAVLAWFLGRRLLHRRTFAGAAAFLLGSLPFWLYNIPRDFVTLRMGAVGTGTAKPILEQFLTLQLPELLHLSGKSFLPTPRLGRVWLVVGGAAYLLLALPFLWRSLRDAAAFALRRRRTPGEGLFLLFIIVVIFFFSSSRFGHFHTSRYLLPLYSVIPFLGAGALAGAGRLRQRAVRVLLAGIMTANVAFHAAGVAGDSREARRWSEITGDLLRTFEETGTTEGIAEYWLGWRLNFLSAEKTVFSEAEGERYLPYQGRVEAARRPAFLIRGNSSLPTALDGRGVGYKKQRFRGMRLLTDIEVPPEGIRALDRRRWRIGDERAAILTDNLRQGIPEGSSPGRELREAVIDLGDVATPSLVRVLVAAERRALPGEWKVSSSLDGREWREVAAHWPTEHVFISGERAYNGGMFFRCELRLEPAPARYLRLERREALGRRLTSVEELYVYERAGDPRPTAVDDELEEFLRREGVDFVYADRWESAEIVARLGGERVSVPWNGRHHGKNRNGIVGGGERAAFIVPAHEAAPVREILGPEVIGKETVIGSYALLVADLPEGPSGLYWSGFSLLYEGREGQALWQRRRAALLAAGGQPAAAEALLREAVRIAPGDYSARLELADLLAKRRPAEGEEDRRRAREEFSPRNALDAEFEGGVTLLGLDIDAAEEGLRLTYYWSFEGPLAGEVWTFVHLEGEGLRHQDDHRIDDIAHPLMMNSGNIIKDVRFFRAPGFRGSGMRISLGLWRPEKRERLRVLSAETAVRRRALRFSRIIPGN